MLCGIELEIGVEFLRGRIIFVLFDCIIIYTNSTHGEFTDRLEGCIYYELWLWNTLILLAWPSADKLKP